jgi:hypothetical protein
MCKLWDPMSVNVTQDMSINITQDEMMRGCCFERKKQMVGKTDEETKVRVDLSRWAKLRHSCKKPFISTLVFIIMTSVYSFRKLMISS